MRSIIPSGIAWCALAAAHAAFAVDLGTWKGCAADDGQFAVTRLFTGPAIPSTLEGNGALKIAFASHPDGAVDVYFVQKRGAVKRHNGRTGAIDSLGLIPVDNSRGEQGLIGIAIRRDFPERPDLYLAYSTVEATGRYAFRVSRFSLSKDLARLDPASEKVLLRVPRESEDWHTGGAMEFDEYGDLWGTFGDNRKTEIGPGNTADLRGGIYRIHPDDSPRGYSIPAENFGEHFAARFVSQGDAALAAQYRDTARVRPEIYVKGTRNAYNLNLDPVRRWLAFGDVGPDQQKVSEEHNLVKAPAFAGWPYYAGQEDMSAQGGNFYGKPIPAGSTRLAPLNQDPAALGVKRLPSVQEPILARQQGCAMTGPILRYDGARKGAGQIPPQLDRKWFNAGCDGYGFHLMTLDAAGERITADQKIFAQVNVVTLVDFKQGPDGALYAVGWRSGIHRIAYTGACKDEALRPERSGCATPGAPGYDPSIPREFHDPARCGLPVKAGPLLAEASWLRMAGAAMSVEAGPHRVEVADAAGRVIFRREGARAARYDLGGLGFRGICRARVEAPGGTVVRMMVLTGR